MSFPATPWHDTLDDFYAKAMIKGGHSSITLSYSVNSDDTNSFKQKIIEDIGKTLSNGSYITSKCYDSLTLVSHSPPHAGASKSGIKANFFEKSGTLLINYKRDSCYYLMDSSVECSKIFGADISYRKTGRHKNVNAYKCDEYAAEYNKDTLMVWVCNKLSGSINPGIYCRYGAVIEVNYKNYSTFGLIQLSVGKTPEPTITLVCTKHTAINLFKRIVNLMN